MHSDRVIVLIRRVTELASRLSQLEYLRGQVAEAQRRASAMIAKENSSNAKMVVRTKLLH